MKVLYDYQVFSNQEYGGISRYFCELAERLPVYEDTELRIFSPLHINHYLKENSRLNVAGRYMPPISNTLKIRNFVNKYLEKRYVKNSAIDIVHETLHDKENTYPKTKSVVTVYDMIAEKYQLGGAKQDRFSMGKKRTVERADHVICISENTKKDLLEYVDIDPDKVSVTYLGSSLKKPQDMVSPVTDPYILYVGNRSKYKNFSTFIEAYAASDKLKNDFKVVCFGGGAFKSAEKKYLNELKISENKVINIAGDDLLLAQAYASASVFIYPSLYEGFGIPPLEAMNADCPVVCSHTSSIPEVTGKAVCYVDPSSAEDIKAALEDVLYADEKRQELVRRGRERRLLFSWDKCSEETLRVYEKLL